MTPALAIWIAAALAAYVVKGFSGFGPALIVVPAVAALYSPTTALATSAVLDLVVGIVLVVLWPPTSSERRLLAKLCTSIAIGSAIGASVAGILPTRLLLVAVGITVLGLAIRLGVTGQTGFGPRPSTWLAGLTAGISGGLVGVSGPFVVATAAQDLPEKGSLRRLLVAVFLVENVVKIGVYFASGVITPQAFSLSAWAAPAVAAGLAIGAMLHNRVSEKTFRRGLVATLVLTGFQPILQAL